MLIAFHCLLFVSSIQLPSMLSLINIFLTQTTVTPFSMTFLLLSKNFVNLLKKQPSGGVLWKRCSENTQQRNTSCEFVPIKMRNVNHVLCKSFLPRDPIPAVSPGGCKR